MAPTSAPLTAALAGYVAGAPGRELPSAVVAQAKLCVLDAVACAIGGSSLPPAAMASDLAIEMGGLPEATVFVAGARVPAPWAAFANSAATNALDMDDTQEGHPGASIVAPALAMAERERTTGRRLLEAVVVGYDICDRIGSAMRPTSDRYRQVYGFGTFQIMSSGPSPGTWCPS